METVLCIWYMYVKSVKFNCVAGNYYRTTVECGNLRKHLKRLIGNNSLQYE